ncbi:hypothetical protein [Jannaschia formosa]|uniref:hypothetical protein n=1 Tax=Jannaschia formosa TaxID=2259592 RepID=UPI0010753ABD|nr:hypothetical protein [Jannaschia formosa]TFL16183.1 hypothetical protein DR046_21280 [Jannaschia formosa]
METPGRVMATDQPYPRPSAQTTAPTDSEIAAPWGGNEHPLLDIPFTAVVDGRTYRGEVLSLVEAHVSGLADPSLSNRERLVRLGFQFQGFSVALDLAARIELVSERSLRLIFTEPAGEHLPQLRYLLNEHLSGDLTSLGSVIRATSLAGPANGKNAAARRGFAAGLRSFLGSLMALALTLGLLGTAALLVEQRLLVADLASPGRVAHSGETLRATADGQINYFASDAGEGEVAFAIASTRGETLSVAMPCDCTARALGVAEGSTVLAGEPVMRLSEAGAAVIVEARVTAEEFFDLRRAGAVDIVLADGTTHAALLSETPPRALEGDDFTGMTVHLTPVDPIPDALVGQAVALRAHTDAGALFAPAADVLNDLEARGEPVLNALRDLGARGEIAFDGLRDRATRAWAAIIETLQSTPSPE